MPLLEAIVSSSMPRPQTSENLTKKLNTISNPVEVKIFVTPTCPSCPDMVRVADSYSHCFGQNIHGDNYVK